MNDFASHFTVFMNTYCLPHSRTIQSLQSVLRKASGRIQDFGSGSSNSNEQSIVEMASVNSSLVEETLKLAGSVLPAFSVSEMSFMVNHQAGENLAELKMQPTSAEKLAFEVKPESVKMLFFLPIYCNVAGCRPE